MNFYLWDTMNNISMQVFLRIYLFFTSLTTFIFFQTLPGAAWLWIKKKKT